MSPLPVADPLEAVVDVLRAAARHDNLLTRPAFDDLAAALARHVPFARLTVITTEPAGGRVYATTRGGPADVVPFGQLFPIAASAERLRALGQDIAYCDDTRAGDDLDRRTAAAGMLSYVSVPLGAVSPTVQALLIIAFRGVAEARSAPVPLLRELGEVFGHNFVRAVVNTRQKRLAMILETSGDAMLAWDGGGRITDANAAAAALTGIARDALIGSPIAALFGEVPDPARSQDNVRLEISVRGPAGASKAIVSATITAVADDPEVAAHALLRDRSAVAVAEREAELHLLRVRELEQEHRSLLDNAPFLIFRLDSHSGDLRYLNRHAERLLGVSPDVALRTPGFLRGIHADARDAAAFDEAVERARLGVVGPPYEARLQWSEAGKAPSSDAEDIVVRGTVYPLLDAAGAVMAIEGVLVDVSAERAARTRLVQADRLTTIGTLAASVAHEINNPAAFILLGLDLLDRLLAGPGVTMDHAVRQRREELLGELRDSIRRIVDIARDLRLFASPPRKGHRQTTVVDVNGAVESALGLTRSQLLERARVSVQLAEVPPVVMDDGRLGQVLVNLLVNAAQAIPAGHQAADHQVRVVTRSDGRTVCIEVVDTGVGIAPGDAARIWTPFFTTKSPETGTGLGLSISREIVERAQGTMRAESPVAEGHGARFVIELPAAGRAEVRTPGSGTLPRIPTRRGRLLVVEDEPALARALADELGQVHDVVVADGGERALSMLRTHRFDAILCDLRMPGVSGEALYGRVRESDPAQAERFVFMTGVGFGAEVERFLTGSGRQVLEKPFTTERALREIARLLQRQGAIDALTR